MKKKRLLPREYDLLNKNPDGSLIRDISKEPFEDLSEKAKRNIEKIAKQDFLGRTNGIKDLSEASRFVVNYVEDVGYLEIGLKYKNHYVKDGSVDVNDFYKILGREFKGKGFKYDSSREMFEEISNDFKDVLNYLLKPYEVSLFGSDKAVVQKRD